MWSMREEAHPKYAELMQDRGELMPDRGIKIVPYVVNGVRVTTDVKKVGVKHL